MGKLTNFQLRQLVKSVNFSVDEQYKTTCVLETGSLTVTGYASITSVRNYNKLVGERIAYINALSELRKELEDGV